ncbi:MAG: DNA-binding protein [Desulfurococcaceae archaeon]
MSGSSERQIVVSTKPIRDYIIEIAIMFQEGANSVVIKGYGKFISKAVDLYNAVSSRMKDSIELSGVSIGSEIVQGRSKPYIAIRIKRRY